MIRVLALVAILGATLAGCAAGDPILANPAAPHPSAPAPTLPPVAIADPLPVVLPRDDGPHERLTEWWYYTGHLRSADGQAKARSASSASDRASPVASVAAYMRGPSRRPATR